MSKKYNKKVIKKEDHGLVLTPIKQATRTRYFLIRDIKKQKGFTMRGKTLAVSIRIRLLKEGFNQKVIIVH